MPHDSGNNPILESDMWRRRRVHTWVDRCGTEHECEMDLGWQTERARFISETVLPALGFAAGGYLPGRTYPDIRHERRGFAEGFWFVLRPSARDTERRSFRHRLFVVCGCGREIPLGRVGQHRCGNR